MATWIELSKARRRDWIAITTAAALLGACANDAPAPTPPLDKCSQDKCDAGTDGTPDAPEVDEEIDASAEADANEVEADVALEAADETSFDASNDADAKLDVSADGVLDAPTADGGDAPPADSTTSDGAESGGGDSGTDAEAGVSKRAHCGDGSRDNGETDIDCGGSECDRCALGQACGVNADCTSGGCHATQNVCVSSHCEDAQKDADESDVDCGGALCAKCDLNRPCNTNDDCKTGTCGSGYCALASGPPFWLPFVKMNQAHCGSGLLTKGRAHPTLVAFGPDTTYEVYDPDQIAWGMPEPIPAPGIGVAPAAMSADGRLFVFGGGVTRVFDGSWSVTGTPMPIPRSWYAAVGGPDNLIYTAGGGGGGIANNVFEAYDLLADRWVRNLPPMPTPRYLLAGAALGNRLYFLGGSSPSVLGLKTAEAYDVVKRSWSVLADMPLAVASLTAAAGADGRVYAMGGESQQQLHANVNAYDPVTDRWAPVAPLLYPRTSDGFPTAVTSITGDDGRIYAFGGALAGVGAETTVDAYGPVISFSPSSGAPGDLVTVIGRNFAANAIVSVFAGDQKGTLLKTGATNAKGDLYPPITLPVPDVSPGEKVITLVDDRSQYPIRGYFTVNAPPPPP